MWKRNTCTQQTNAFICGLENRLQYVRVQLKLSPRFSFLSVSPLLKESFSFCSCSVKTKPSLFFSLCLPTFKGIILVLFLSCLCRLRENPLLQYFFAHLSSSHPCLLHHPTGFFPFFLRLDFSFFSFSCFYLPHCASA